MKISDSTLRVIQVDNGCRSLSTATMQIRLQYEGIRSNDVQLANTQLRMSLILNMSMRTRLPALIHVVGFMIIREGAPQAFVIYGLSSVSKAEREEGE